MIKMIPTDINNFMDFHNFHNFQNFKMAFQNISMKFMKQLFDLELIECYVHMILSD
jgi:hypothetical protein